MVKYVNLTLAEPGLQLPPSTSRRQLSADLKYTITLCGNPYKPPCNSDSIFTDYPYKQVAYHSDAWNKGFPYYPAQHISKGDGEHARSILLETTIF